MSDQERSGSVRPWEEEDPIPSPALPPGEVPSRSPNRAIPLGPSTLPGVEAGGDAPGAAGGDGTRPPAGGGAGPEPWSYRPEPSEPGPSEESEEEVGPDRDEHEGPTISFSSPADPLSPEEPYSAEAFEAEEDEPFNLPGTQKLGIVGGKGVGKSFLFQAMVYRTYSKAQAGVMSYYLHKTRLFYALQREEKAKSLTLSEFNNKYTSWERLPQTLLTTQQWYRLRLHYRTGILGKTTSAMDVEFFDGAGEGFFEAARSPGIRKLWREGYLDARVMVFCLPLWAAFPGRNLTQEDHRERKALLLGFEKVVQNYEDLREEGKRTYPVKSILAFTMADDPRSALATLKDQWLAPYLDSPQLYLRQLRSGSGVARYLANARRISEALHEELLASRDRQVSSIPERLDFGGGRPWLIPVSALDGKFLDRIEGENKNRKPEERPVLPEPVPVHVELPLLVALCERHNALM